MKSVLFIPVWNQIAEFPAVLKELKESNLPVDEVLIVNNGSDDGSEVLVRNSGYRYIDLPANRGVGYSFMRAVDWALKRDFDVFSCMASNGKMLASELPRVLSPVLIDEADYVTGSRFLPGGSSPHLPTFRRSSIPLVNLFVRFLTGAKLSDATCGYKAMRLSIFQQAEFDWHAPSLNTYGFEYYLYAKVILSGRFRWMEVPITMRYPGRGKPYSKMTPFKSWYEMLKPWVIARFDGKGFMNLVSPSLTEKAVVGQS